MTPNNYQFVAGVLPSGLKAQQKGENLGLSHQRPTGSEPRSTLCIPRWAGGCEFAQPHTPRGTLYANFGGGCGEKHKATYRGSVNWKEANVTLGKHVAERASPYVILPLRNSAGRIRCLLDRPWRGLKSRRPKVRAARATNALPLILILHSYSWRSPRWL